MISQDDFFKSGEGDRYFDRRKKSNWSDEERIQEDLSLKLINKNNVKFKYVAEIGAYNGFRLSHLMDIYDCKAVAFELSTKAIANGRKKYPGVKFRCNTADKLYAEDGAFDLVLISFVLHWIDRRNLLRSVAEIDRVLSDNGWLLVSDFWVDYPQRRRYHHLPDQDVWTFKQNYWEIFLSTQCYQLVDIVYKLPSGKDTVRRNCALLKKNLNNGYPIVKEDMA